MNKPNLAFVLRINPSGIDGIPDALKGNYVTIGWSHVPEILRYAEWIPFRNAVHKTYYSKDISHRRSGLAAGALWQFIKEMEIGSWVVVPALGGFYVAEVTGEAKHFPEHVEADCAFRRSVNWLNGKKPIPRSLATAALQARMKIHGTCARAWDLVDAIAAALSNASTTTDTGKEFVFRRDLHARVVQSVLSEIREGRIENFGFELLLKSLFEREGAKVEIVPRRLDKGVDLKVAFRVGPSSFVVGVQAKHFQAEPPVPAEVADKLVEGLEHADADAGMIVTSGTISKELEERVQEIFKADGVRIQLVDGEMLAAWLVESGIEAPV